MTDEITAPESHETAGVEDWRVVFDGACAYFRTQSFAPLRQRRLGGADDSPTNNSPPG